MQKMKNKPKKEESIKSILEFLTLDQEMPKKKKEDEELEDQFLGEEI